MDLRDLFSRQLSVLGSRMGSDGDLRQVLDLVARGRLRPVLDRVLPLAEAAEAHRLMESGEFFGKLVLQP